MARGGVAGLLIKATNLFIVLAGGGSSPVWEKSCWALWGGDWSFTMHPLPR